MSVWHYKEDTPALGHDTPNFAEQLAELFRTLECMYQQHTVHRHIGQWQVVFRRQRDNVPAPGRPPHYALLGGHEGNNTLGLVSKLPHIGRGITDPGDALTSHIWPGSADIAPNNALRGMPKRRIVEVAKIDDIVIHPRNMRQAGT